MADHNLSNRPAVHNPPLSPEAYLALYDRLYEHLSKTVALIAMLQGQDNLPVPSKTWLDYVAVLDTHAQAAYQALAQMDGMQRYLMEVMQSTLNN